MFKCIKCLNFKFSWKIVEWLALLGLLFVTGFFVNKVWDEYVSKVSSVKTNFEVQKNLDLPVIVMCLNPSIQPPVMERYNKTLHSYLFNSNLTMYEEAIYEIGRDFNITFDGEEVNQDIIEIKKLYTFVSALCYRINTNIKRKVMQTFLMNVKMSKKLEYFPKLSFYFTSDQNSYNVIDERLVGNILYLETKSTGYHTVLLQKSEYKKLEEISDCNEENTIPMECISKRF